MSEIIRHVKKTMEDPRTKRTGAHLQKIRQILKENGVNDGITNNDIDILSKENHRGDPSFPIIMFEFSGVMDVIDFFEPTGVMAVVGFFLQIAWFVVSYIWFTGKLKGTWWKKLLLKRAVWLAVCIIVLELTPIADMFIPGNIILIVWAHYRHTKVVRIGNEILEIINLYYSPSRND